MLFFIALKDEVKTRTSLLATSTASCSLRPTKESGGMLMKHNRIPCHKVAIRYNGVEKYIHYKENSSTHKHIN
jgi:hypothetical protein